MADALVGIGADLSALTSSLQQIPRIAGTEADKAIRKVQQMSIRASRGVSKAIRQQARENQRAQQAAERAARRSAAANEQVRQVMLAAERETMTASQRAASALQEELRALDRLAAKGAEVAQVERARAAAVAAGARKIAAARAQELGVSAPSRGDTGQMAAFASATAGAAKSSSELARAGQSVAMQIPDVITQLSMGTPVLIVLAQQGLQVVQQNMQLVMRAAKGLAAMLSGPVAIAAGVVVAAFSVVANHLDETRHRMRSFEEAVNSTAAALSTSQLKSYAQAQRDIAEAVDDANLVLAQELGIVDSLDIAQMRAVESIKEAARATTLEAAAIYAKLQVQRQELMQRLHSGELDRYEEDAAKRRIRQLDEQLPRAKAVIDAIKDDVEARQMQVFETYEQIEAIRLEREAQREAEKATRRGSKAIAIHRQERDRRARPPARRARRGGKRRAAHRRRGIADAGRPRANRRPNRADQGVERGRPRPAYPPARAGRRRRDDRGRANGRRSRDGIRRSADGADLGHVDRRHRTRGGRKSRRRALNSHRRRARGGRQSCRYDWAIA
jgi:hypothetical protein